MGAVSRNGAIALFIFCFGLFSLPHTAWTQAFDGCVRNIDNATVVVPASVEGIVADEAMEDGDEIAVFTSDSTCAGRGIWSGESLSIAVAGAGSQNPEGFASDEPLQFRVWDASSGTIYTSEVTYTPCDGSTPICMDEGLYKNNMLYSLSEIRSKSALPVELAAFQATVSGSGATLRWETASETNNAGFEIQHQAPQAGDGEWTRASFVEGHGTTSDDQQYAHRINDLRPGTHQFRLKQIDLDGNFEYSATVEAVVELQGPFELVAPYPNPFRQRATFTLMVAEAQQVDITAYNQLGQRVATLHRGTLEPDAEHTFRLAARRLSSGLYFIQIHGETFSTTERAVLVR